MAKKKHTFILSDDSVNSYGFSIDLANSSFERFQNNPVMFYNHWDLIGNWTNVRLENGKLLAEPNFMTAPEETTALKTAKRVEDGFLKGASLGINILKWTEEDGKAPVATVDVYECSIVDIPSNANAIMLYDSNGVKLEGDAIHLALSAFKTKTQKTNDTMKLNQTSFTTLGIADGASDDQINNAIAALAAKASRVETAEKALTDLQATVELSRQKEIDTMITVALKEGRITADKKESFEKLAKTDFDLAKQMINDLPKKVSLAGKEVLENNRTTELGDREGWTFADWRKKDTAGLLKIKESNPDLYKSIIDKV